MTTRGEKIHRLQLQKRKNTVNSANETIPDPTWEDITYCWASITPLGGSEYTQDSLMVAVALYTILVITECRWYSEIGK